MIQKFIFRRPLGDKTPGTLVEIHVILSSFIRPINWGNYEKLIATIRETFPQVDRRTDLIYLGMTRDLRYNKALAEGPLYPKTPIVVWRTDGSKIPKQSYPWNEFETGIPWYKWELR